MKNNKKIIGVILITFLLIISFITVDSTLIQKNDIEQKETIILQTNIGSDENLCDESNQALTNPTTVNQLFALKTVWAGENWMKFTNAQIGDTITFNITIRYEKYCGVMATNISVNDTLPSCLDYVEGSSVTIFNNTKYYGDNGTDGQKIFWNITDKFDINLFADLDDPRIPPHYVSIYYNATVTECTDTIGEKNIVQVDALETCCGVPLYGDDEAIVKVDCGEPDITIEKYVKLNCEGFFSKEVDAGIDDWVTFMLYANNTGDLPINISVKDTLPSGFSYIADSSDITGISVVDEEPDISGSDLYWNFTDVPAGTSIMITFRAEVDDCGELVNEVNVTGEYDSEIIYDDDNATVNVLCEDAGITIEKYVKWACEGFFSKEVDAGIDDWVTFMLYANNTGDLPINISVKDTLPSGFSYIADSSDITGISVVDEEPDISGSDLYWNFTDVPAGTSIMITFRAEVDDCGELVNEVNVTGEYDSEIIYDDDNATVNVLCEDAGITIEKYVKWACEGFFSKEVDAGIDDWVTFMLYANNTGDLPINISVKDTLPSGFSYIADSSDITGISVVDEEPDISGSDLYWNFTDVPAGTSIMITFRAEVDDCGELVNEVNVTGEYDSEIIYDDDNATVNVDCPTPMMILEKKVWNETSGTWEEEINANIGDTVRFNITIEYYGENIFYNVNITDTLPTGLEYANNAVPVESWINGKDIYWNLTDDYDVHLNGGEKYYIEFDATVTSTGDLINIVNLTSNECSGIIMYGEDDAIVHVEESFGLICEKKVKDKDGSWVDEIDANVGDRISFKITVKYIGTKFIYNIWIEDILPDCLEYDNNANPEEPSIDGNTLLWHFQDDYLDPGDSITITYYAIVISEGIGNNVINVQVCECSECDELLCSDNAIVNCFADLNADASASPTQIDEGDTVTFTGQASGGVSPYTWSWDFDDGDVSNSQSPTHQFNSAGQYTVELTVTDSNLNTDSDTVTITVNQEDTNTKPNKPNKPTGETNGEVDIEYTYTTSTSDPDGDQLFYLWDWGDGTNSGWLGPYSSGTTVSALHSWGEKTTYEVKVRAKDPDGLLSDWSDPLSVTMPKNIIQNFIIQILIKLSEKFDFIEKIIDYLNQ